MSEDPNEPISKAERSDGICLDRTDVERSVGGEERGVKAPAGRGDLLEAAEGVLGPAVREEADDFNTKKEDDPAPLLAVRAPLFARAELSEDALVCGRALTSTRFAAALFAPLLVVLLLLFAAVSTARLVVTGAPGAAFTGAAALFALLELLLPELLLLFAVALSGALLFAAPVAG